MENALEKHIADIFNETGLATKSRKYDFAEELQDALIKISHLMHPKSPWISVSDKMPEEFKVVIAYAANGHIENSYWDGHYWTGDFYDTTVICWMPIPELPKGGKK